MEREEKSEAYQIAIRFIKYRPRSVLEVRRKLLEKGYSKELSDEIIGRLLEEGILDDTVFAEAWARERLSGRNFGRKKVDIELRKKGIDQEVIKNILEEITSGEDPADSAVKFLRTKFPRSINKIPQMKMIRLLIRNGYEITTAKEAVKRAAIDEGE